MSPARSLTFALVLALQFGWLKRAEAASGAVFVSMGPTVNRYDSETGLLNGTFTGFDEAVGLTILADGTVLVAEQDAQRIVRLSGETFATTSGVIPGIFGLVTEPTGSVFVSSASLPAAPKVVEFNGAGTFVQQTVASSDDAAGGLAFAFDGTLLVGGSGEVRRYDAATGTLLGVPIADDALSDAVNGILATPSSIIVADTRNGLFEYDADGVFIRQISAVEGFVGIALDSFSGRLFVGNGWSGEVHVFDWPSGTPWDVWNVGAAADVEFLPLPDDITINLIPGRIAIVKPGTFVKFVAKPLRGDTFARPTTNPVMVGGSLRIFDTAATAGDDAYPLPSGAAWEGLGNPAGSKGYRYKGAGTPADPCKVVLIKETGIKAVCKGTGITLTPPFMGDIGIVLRLGSTERYCAQFGGDEVKNDGTLTKRKNAPAPAVCP